MEGYCKNCDHAVMDWQGKMYHYRTFKGEELAETCWEDDCDCKKAEAV